ncbi:hypothetical protein HPP92_004897 [Vanilla planifolia]|uniref:Pollen-specific protein SF21 n=1 Tax=Vanilla planifolia TaxID=51239 RepID=A0A835RNN9_VANPL|nr:hypothetical protein HPP92_004897 [Vanilla planifolia]
MGESSGSVSIDVRIFFGESLNSVTVGVEFLRFIGVLRFSAACEHLIRTSFGPVSVAVFGDLEKPALVTYPDLALSCQLFRLMVDSGKTLQMLTAVMCMGVTSGAYILTLFASKYRDRVLGLILVSPICKTPSWTEWFYNKVISNLLYFYGMCGMVKGLLLQRYFSKELRGSSRVPESDVVQACRRILDERQNKNIWRSLQSMNQRRDLTEELKKLQCRMLIFVGDSSPFLSDARYMTSKLDGRYRALVEVQACGSLVTEEQPHAMLIPMEYFLMGYGLHRPSQLSSSPRSPLSPSCISPELFSPESMGVKLKPIKTRIS